VEASFRKDADRRFHQAKLGRIRAGRMSGFCVRGTGDQGV
jgi:hypothetical protein